MSRLSAHDSPSLRRDLRPRPGSNRGPATAQLDKLRIAFSILTGGYVVYESAGKEPTRGSAMNSLAGARK